MSRSDPYLGFLLGLQALTSSSVTTVHSQSPELRPCSMTPLRKLIYFSKATLPGKDEPSVNFILKGSPAAGQRAPSWEGSFQHKGRGRALPWSSGNVLKADDLESGLGLNPSQGENLVRQVV